MAAVLQFRSDVRRTRRGPDPGEGRADELGARGVVVIFPGVRVERAGLDLSHRLVPVTPAGDSASGSPASGS